MSETASLITLRSILDIEIARTYQWDATTIITVSGVDRAGDLTTRIVECPGALADIAAEGFSPHSAAGHALSHELHDAIQRRVRLWLAIIPTDQLPRLSSTLGADLIHEAGTPSGGNSPIALSPLALLEAWAQGTAEQREFIRVAMAGLDTLSTASHATRAARRRSLHHRAQRVPQAVPQPQVHRLRRRFRLLDGARRSRHVRATFRR